MERELWRRISKAITVVERFFPRGNYTHPVGRIVRVYFWAVLHDRPVYWACRRENWRGVRPPAALPHQSRMSRRLRQNDTQEFLKILMAHLNEPARGELLKIIDGKPLPVSRHSEDPDATFGRGAGGLNKGYKLHAIYGQAGRLVAWQVQPMNVDERTVAAALIAELSDEGYLLGDSHYDANHLYATADEHGHQLIAGRRCGAHRGLGHRRHARQRLRSVEMLEGPSQFGPRLYQQRRRIETYFGNLCSFGGGLTCLPPWVRTLSRVRLYVAAKILIRTVRNHIIRDTAA